MPGPEETKALFDLPLYDRGIQPVWLEVSNGTDAQIRYAPVGTDREYFAPLEVSYVHRSGLSKEGLAAMNRHFYDVAMPRRIPAGETRSGFVFTHAQPGTKAFNVDLFGPSRDSDLTFTFFVDVPGFQPDHSIEYFEELYRPDQILALDRDELRSTLADMDLSTVDEAGQREGAPINVIVVGHPEEVLQALIRANWVETPRHGGELTEHFRGRVADVVFRKNQSDDGERNELRFWLSPLRAGETPVWYAQTMHFIGGRKGRGQLDPDLDDATVFLLQDIWYGQGLQRYAWLQSREKTPVERPRQTFEGAEFFSSGLLLVIWASGPTVSMLDVETLDWDLGP